MKKIFVMLFLLTIGIYVSAQNSIFIQGTGTDSTVMFSGSATAYDSIVVPQVFNGEWDISLQLVPFDGGKLTSDSVYCTTKLVFNNLSAGGIWSERAKIAETMVDTTGVLVQTEYQPERKVMSTTTVALSPGLTWVIPDMPFKRIAVQIQRPVATHDTLGYKLNWVAKLHQEKMIP